MSLGVLLDSEKGEKKCICTTKVHKDLRTASLIFKIAENLLDKYYVLNWKSKVVCCGGLVLASELAASGHDKKNITALDKEFISSTMMAVFLRKESSLHSHQFSWLQEVIITVILKYS